jgi:hypothetical protein
MPDNRASYTVVLNTDGSAQVKGDLAAVTEWAQKSAAQTSAAYDKTASAAENASAREIAAAKRAEDAERRRMAATAQRISDTLDPTARPTRDFQAESARAGAALKSGLIGQAQYDTYLLKLKKDLEDTTRGMKEHGGILGLNRAQYITAQSAVLRFSDSVIAGRSPLTALSLESHKLVEIMSMGEGGMAAALTQVSALFNPMVIGAAALTIGLVAGAAAGYAYSERLDVMSRAADGFGRTSQLTGAQLLDTAAKHAEAGQISVAAAGEIETAILRQTRTSDAALGQAIDIAQRFADAMGIDVAKAAEQLGKSLADPARAADELTMRFGYLTQAQVEHIHQLMEQNRLTEAQSSLLANLDNSLDKAGEHVNALTRAFRALMAAMSDGWNNLGQSIDHAMGVYTDAEKIADLQGKIAAQQQYLQTPGHYDLFSNDNTVRQQITDEQKQLAGMLKPQQDARANQLGSQAREIASKYGLDAGVQPKLEQLKTELATLQDAQRAGQHVNADTLDALNHAIRTFMTPEQKRIAEQTARAALRQAAPHSAAREAAGQQLMDATTSGQVVTEAGARTLAEERGLQALGHAGKGAGAGRAETARRNAEAMNVEAAAALHLADAYLQGDAAALKAEAYRKAATDATRKGIDVTAQAARELNKMVADQVASTAKSIRATEDDTAARNHALDLVKAGTISASDLQRTLAREKALRQEVTLATVAQGDALKHLTADIAAHRKALDDADAATIRQAAEMAISAANDNASASALRAKLAGVRDPVAIARANAQDYASQQEFAAPDASRYVDAKGAEAQAKQAADSAVWLTNEQRRIDLAMQLSTVQNSMDEDAIRRQTLINQLDQQNIALTQQQIDTILAGQKAEKKWADQVAQHTEAMKQLKADGAQALDQLLSPDGIEHWGQTWHNVIRKILTDLEQMAILNPLENMLFGGNRATLGGGGGGAGGLGGLLGSLFGGGGFNSASALSGVGSGLSFDSASAIAALPALASGTDSARGGPTLVGENGPELVNLPSGAGVMTAGETRAALSGGGGNLFHMPISIDARGAGPREVDQLRAELQTLRRDMPTIAVRATNEATQRRLGNAA